MLALLLRSAGRRRIDGLQDLPLLLRSAGPRGPAGRQWTRTNGLPDLLLRSAGPCGPAGRRRMDRLPYLLLLLRSAGPCGPARPGGDEQTDFHSCCCFARPARGPAGPRPGRGVDSDEWTSRATVATRPFPCRRQSGQISPRCHAHFVISSPSKKTTPPPPNNNNT